MCPYESTFVAGSGRGNGVRAKTIRVLRMAMLLQQADCTVDQLAERFEVSRRTIYRDLQLIDEADLALVCRHAGRGYRLLGLRGTPMRR